MTTFDLIQTDINLNQQALDEWIEYRKEIKKPLTKSAVAKVAKKLALYCYQTQQKMVDQSIENNWRGLFEVEFQEIKEPSSFIEKHTDTSWANGIK